MFSLTRKIIRCFMRIILLSILCFIGYWCYTNYQILQKVHQYEDTVTTEVTKNQIPEYKALVASIILTESKGIGKDPMQSSESSGQPMNSIQNPQQSIEQGTAFLAQAIRLAKAKHTDIWTAVQAYNFGLAYIDYVAEHGGKHTIDLAETYSRDVLSPKLGNQTQKQYRYFAWRSLMHNGGYLYHNGGNMFYADLVKVNEYKIQATNGLFH